MFKKFFVIFSLFVFSLLGPNVIHAAGGYKGTFVTKKNIARGKHDNTCGK